MWSPDDFPDGSFVEVDRVFQRLGTSARLAPFAEDYEEWNAIKAIEATGDGIALDPKSIILVAKRWLLGLPVEPDPTTPQPAEPYVSLVTRPLLASTGLAMVEPAPVGRSAADMREEENDGASQGDLAEKEERKIEEEDERANLSATSLPALSRLFCI